MREVQTNTAHTAMRALTVISELQSLKKKVDETNRLLGNQLGVLQRLEKLMGEQVEFKRMKLRLAHAKAEAAKSVMDEFESASYKNSTEKNQPK